MSMFEFPFPVFEGSFTPWENQDDDDQDQLLSNFFHPTTQDGDGDHGDGDHEDADQLSHPANSNSNNSGSDEPSNQPAVSFEASAMDERKRRRMISNRESARRSRMRKQRHLEGLRNQLNRLRTENRDISNRLGFLTHRCHLVRRDNDRLRSESVALKQRLSYCLQIGLFRQLQQQQQQPQHHPPPPPPPPPAYPNCLKVTPSYDVSILEYFNLSKTTQGHAGPTTIISS